MTAEKIVKIKTGDTVKVDYEGQFENGEVFDTSTHGDHSHPLEFEVGAGYVIKGFDDAVLDLKEGDEKEFSINPKDAYGEIDKKLLHEIPRNVLPQEQEPKEGMVLMMVSPQGQQIPARIAKVGKEKVTIDLNHPLAGKKLIFKIKVIGIKPKV